MSRAAIALVALVLAAAPAAGQDASRAEPVVIHLVPEPRASTALGEITVGDRFWVAVRSQGPPGYRLLPQSLIDAFAPHPELAIVGTHRRDGLWQLQIALFRPGDVVLPEVQARVVTERGDTIPVRVTSDTMRVTSVLAPGDTLLADIKPLWRPSGIPAWVWWLLAALAALLAALLWWRRRRPGAVVPAREPRDVYLEARERIAALGVEPSDPEQAIAAAAGIGEALRDYLADGWGVAARERTTLELLFMLPGSMAPARPALGSVLSTSDLAKFARLVPARGEVPGLSARGIEALDRLEATRRQTAPAATAREAAS